MQNEINKKLPIRAQKLISEYSKPITRANWRKGSYCNSVFLYNNYNKILHKMVINWFRINKICYKKLENHTSIIEDMQIYGEDLFVNYVIDKVIYNNYYFILRYFKLLNNSHCIYYNYIYNNVYDLYLYVEWIQAID